jgi:hypothetical protein
MRLGEVLRAEVLEHRGGGQALIRIGGQSILAQCPRNLEIGVPFHVNITSLSPQILLRIMPNHGQLVGFLRQSLWRTLPFLESEAGRRLWSEAFQEWRSLDARGRPGILSTLLQNRLGPGSWNTHTYLLSSGLMFEAKLAGRVKGFDTGKGPWPDLKGQLQRILHGESEGVDLRATKGIINLIRGCQSLSLLSKEGETTLYLPLMLWGFEEGDWGDLRIQGEGTEKDAARSWKVTIRLDLSTIGRLRIQLHLHKRTLHCEIKSSEDSTLKLIRSELSGLQERLAALNFQRVRCRCGSIVDPDDWTEPLLSMPEGLLKVRA